MSSKPLNRCRNSREFSGYLSHRGAIHIGQVGSHSKWRGPNGAQVIIPCHNGDLPRGTISSIVKMIVIAGLGVAVVACSYLAMITA